MGRKIENEELIKEVQILSNELGRTPLRDEFKHYKTALRRFGKWSIFLEKAGLRPNLIKNNFDNVSNKELLEIIKEEFNTIGSTTFNDYNRFRSKNSPSPIYILKKLNLTWNELLTKLDVKINVKNLTNEELLNQLVNLSKKIGKTPAASDLLKEGISPSIYDTRFGNYNTALELAGLEKNAEKKEVTHTKEELLNMYINLCKKLGRDAIQKEIDEYLEYSSNVFILRFGSINNLRELAGYERMNHKCKYSKEDIKRKLIAAYRKNNNKRLTHYELTQLKKEFEDFPSISTICRHFKTTKISDVWDEIEKDLD